MHVRSIGFGQTPEFDTLKAKYLSLVSQIRTTTDPAAKLTLLTSFLNTIGNLSRNAPTPDLATRWLAKYRSLTSGLAYLRATLTERPPSSFMLALSNFSDSALSFGSEVVSTVGTAAKGIARILPIGLLAVLGIAGLIAFGYVKHGGVRIQRA